MKHKKILKEMGIKLMGRSSVRQQGVCKGALDEVD